MIDPSSSTPPPAGPEPAVPWTCPFDSFRGFSSVSRRLRYERLVRLEQLAQEESWTYQKSLTNEYLPILYRYVNYTFKRLQEQDRVAKSEDGRFAAFNTGLLSRDLTKPIFGIFAPSKQGDFDPWFFSGFVTDDDVRMGHFRELPRRATYFDNPADLVYDTSLNIVLDKHTIIEREERFPDALRGTNADALSNRMMALD